MFTRIYNVAKLYTIEATLFDQAGTTLAHSEPYNLTYIPLDTIATISRNMQMQFFVNENFSLLIKISLKFVS